MTKMTPMTPEQQLQRLIDVKEWPADLVRRMLLICEDRGYSICQALEFAQQAADNNNLSVLRGGDAALDQMVARAFGFESHEDKLNHLKTLVHDLIGHNLRCIDRGWTLVHQKGQAEQVFREAIDELDASADIKDPCRRAYALECSLKKMVDAGWPHVNSIFVTETAKRMFAEARQAIAIEMNGLAPEVIEQPLM